MKNDDDRYSLMMDAYTELKPELDTTRPSKPASAPAAPVLSQVLAGFGPMPDEALFLGVASDELPVLLNLHDPLPGPILIIGDPGTGKTSLLQTIVRAAGRIDQPPRRVERV
jgi:MoxR-like ATPase